uniref:15.3 kDa salivary protein SP11 n=1 Tax=Phlebotomus perniciosus TaxID=13204 RepID=I7JHR0_PHLPE|nr:15.3 kDa salivary protein SP11 [Phlebotomus perniciosus]
MKQLVVFLALIVLIVICHAEPPSKKCRSGLVKDEECILHCEYKYYGFTDDNFELDSDLRGHFRTAMRKRGAIRIDQERQLDKHLKKCAQEAKKSEKCRKIIQYYRCAVNNKLFQYNAYAKAIIALDKTINV